MSKKFKIAKRVNHYDIEDFEDVEIENDFVDKDMVQIIADNEYDPMYDDCETIAVALQLAGYGKVADLEAKLAEYEHRNEQLVDALNGEVFINYKLPMENAQLKQQLAEKEKEIGKLKESSDKNIDYLIEFASLIEDQKDCNRMLKALDRVKQGKKYIIDKQHQDKISFCIEKLEKVKEFVKENESWEIEGSDYSIVYADDVLDKIDNQIEELKKEME